VIARRRVPWSVGALLLAVSLTAACMGHAATASSVDVTWMLAPARPVVGPATLTITLRRPSDGPVTGAAVTLEGHMSHPGMAPVLADATERAPGVYEAPFAFTMQGDWVLLVSALLKDKTRVERRIDVANVRPSG